MLTDFGTIAGTIEQGFWEALADMFSLGYELYGEVREVANGKLIGIVVCYD